MASANTVRIEGLCRTCVSNEACRLAQGSIYPVWHCEMFDDGMPLLGATAPLWAKRTPKVKPAASDR